MTQAPPTGCTSASCSPAATSPRGDMMARQMVNFVYLIGDRDTGEAVVVDPAYAVQDLARHRRGRRHAPDRRPRHALPPRPPRRPDGRVVARGHQHACSSRCRCRSTSRPTRCPGSSARPASARDDLVGHHSGDVVRVGRGGHRADPHARPHAGQPVLPGRRPAGGRRHALPRGLRADRLPRRRPARHVRVPPHPAGPRPRRRHPVPRPPLLRRTRRRAWGRPGDGTTSSGPAPPRSGWPCSASDAVRGV